ncbi:MAG: acetyl-CoA carboxylase biotin carboxyl carrier protein subunit [Myxococcota bacterium]
MPTMVEAHITGTVLRVEKKVGEPVSTGETVLVLESMKMEMPVEAPTAGFIRSIDVEEGQFVSEGEVLAVVDDARAEV